MARTVAPALTSASPTAASVPPCGIETSSAAPSNARSGTAIASATGATALAAFALQPDTRTLHIETSRTMASGAAREITNIGSAAGWSARSTNGSRAMIFGAASNSSALHQAPAPATAKAGTRPRSPLDSDTASTTLAAPIWATNGTVKPKWKRALSRMWASPADRSACTENGACT